MKLVFVLLIFLISQIQAYPQKNNLVTDEVEVVHKSDTQLAEEKLFAYAQIVKGIMKPMDSSVSQNAPSFTLSSLLSLLEDTEHHAGENFEVDEVDYIQQMPDEIAKRQINNALCIDPEQCNCMVRYQLGAAKARTNGVVTADCWIVNIPYCEGPCYGIFRYVIVRYK